jgi:hypothetical protein
MTNAKILLSAPFIIFLHLHAADKATWAVNMRFMQIGF